MEEMNEKVENFMDYVDEFSKDKEERLKHIAKIDELLGNYGSVTNEETTEYKVED